jgi:hypothetical protein
MPLFRDPDYDNVKALGRGDATVRFHNVIAGSIALAAEAANSAFLLEA